METSKILVEKFSDNLDRFRVPLSSKERENKKGNIPYYGAAKIIDYVDGFTHSGLSVLIAEDGSVEDENGYPVLQLANGKYWVNNHTHVLKGKNDTDTKYLYYALKTIKISPFVTGAVQKKISQKALNSIQIPYFDDENKRKRIVDILGGIDEKIELNTQTNQTLESIAQAIFKSWFIDFDPVRAKAQALADGKTAHQANLAAMAAISGKAVETLNETEYQQLWQIAEAFPSEFGENGLPAGWKYRNADDLFEIGIGKTPPRKETEWFSDNPDDMEWISIKDMGNQGNFITESSEYLKFEAVEKFNIKKIPENTVILSFKLTVGRVAITTKETTTNEAIAHFKISDKSNLSTEFLFCYLKSYDFENLGSTSSIAIAVNSKMIKDMEILEPNKAIVREFDNYIEIIFRKIKENLIQNKNLMRIRDELLPRLLSGEIAFV